MIAYEGKRLWQNDKTDHSVMLNLNGEDFKFDEGEKLLEKRDFWSKWVFAFIICEDVLYGDWAGQ